MGIGGQPTAFFLLWGFRRMTSKYTIDKTKGM